MHDAFAVDEHAVGYRIIITDNGIDEFMDERVRFEAEPLDGVVGS